MWTDLSYNPLSKHGTINGRYLVSLDISFCNLTSIPTLELPLLMVLNVSNNCLTYKN